MPLLARILSAPLAVDVRRGAVQSLHRILVENQISRGGQVAVVVGRGLGTEVLDRLGDSLPDKEVFVAESGTLAASDELGRQMSAGSYDAVVAIGGGRTLDVAKHAGGRVGLPVVAVATNLAHDGIASPVSSLVHEGRKNSYGVPTPVAVVVDLDFVRRSPPRMVRSGVGDAVSNLCAVADWELAGRERGEAVDGLAVAFARAGAESVLHRADGIEDDPFLVALAEALVLSGLAMSVAGSSRPCSGACHEILHAIDQLFPATGTHGELAGLGALFATWLREDHERARDIARCLDRHALPLRPADVGLSLEQFAEAVVHAPSTRPGRFTVLEHVDLDPSAALEAVRAFDHELSRLAHLEDRTAPHPSR